MTARIAIPSATQERARTAATMMLAVANTLQGFTTADGAQSAEVKLKRIKDDITALQAAVRVLKADAARQARENAKDRALIERSRVMMEVV